MLSHIMLWVPGDTMVSPRYPPNQDIQRCHGQCSPAQRDRGHHGLSKVSPSMACPSCLYPRPFVPWDRGHHGAVHGVPQYGLGPSCPSRPFVPWDRGHHGAVHGVPQYGLVQVVHPVPSSHGTGDAMGLSMVSPSMALSKLSIPSLRPMGQGTPWGCPWCPPVWPCPSCPSRPFIPWDRGHHGAVHGVPQYGLVQVVHPVPSSHGTGDTMGLSMVSPSMALSKLSIPSLRPMGQGTPWGCPWCPPVWPCPSCPSRPFVPWDRGHHGAVHGVPQYGLVQAVHPIPSSHETGNTMECLSMGCKLLCIVHKVGLSINPARKQGHT